LINQNSTSVKLLFLCVIQELSLGSLPSPKSQNYLSVGDDIWRDTGLSHSHVLTLFVCLNVVFTCAYCCLVLLLVLIFVVVLCVVVLLCCLLCYVCVLVVVCCCVSLFMCYSCFVVSSYIWCLKLFLYCV
jgi:hypothetical protein